MNNVNMGGMNAMGGPVGGGNPMMNNGAPGGPRQPINHDQKAQLNTYIYEYFLTNEMYDCARALVSSGQPMNLEAADEKKDGIIGNGADSMDGDSKDGHDSKRPDDLPAPKVPQECPDSCFLYEWWCLFWDMFSAQRGKGETGNTRSYLQYTQAQSRMRQDQQQQQLRQMNARPDMNNMNYQLLMRNQQQNGGLNMNPNDIARKAMQNNRNTTPQQMQLLQQQQKQQQMQRDPSDGNRPQSPGSAENAPSPSKRPRLEGAPFNSQQQAMMPNGRGQGQGLPAQQVGNNGPNNPIQLPNGFDASNLTPQQFQAFQQGQNPGQQQKTLAAYQAGLTQHTQGQMPNKGMQPGGPQNQGSPMMSQGQDGGAIAGYYNAGEMGPGGMRGPPGGQPGGGGNHALQDYQMQLMLLEQQNKKRLMMARQEQDSMAGPGREGMPGPGGPGPGPNGQAFQQGTSPQGRPGASPNPSEQMKRGTPHMSNAGVPSPLPEGQSRGSPGQMGFMPGGNQMDPNMNPQFNGMNGMNMAMTNGMRPPSSHPAGFNGQMNPQMQMARQQQAQAQQQAGWQNGANGPQMMPQPSQGPPQQQGTPQQRNMPPPSVPAAPATANGRTQPSSPQQGAAPPTPSQANKANPKGKKDGNKDTKPKKGGKKGQAPTPAADPEPATPTPATPITPVHPKSFNGQNGAVQQPMTNGQPPAATTAPPQQPDPLGGMGAFDNSGGFDLNGFQFANPNDGNMDVLQDFDFDSFLHQDGEGVDNFSFDTNFMDPGEIGAD